MFSPARLAFVLETLVEWKGSGPDSGPPTERFFVVLLRPAADPLTVIYPIAGVSRLDRTSRIVRSSFDRAERMLNLELANPDQAKAFMDRQFASTGLGDQYDWIHEYDAMSASV